MGSLAFASTGLPLHNFTLPLSNWKGKRRRDGFPPSQSDPSPPPPNPSSPGKSLKVVHSKKAMPVMQNPPLPSNQTIGASGPDDKPCKRKTADNQQTAKAKPAEFPFRVPAPREPKNKVTSADAKTKKKFSVEFAKGGMEEDIYLVTGSMPSTRPKKRPRALQKQLDRLLPGDW